MEDARPTKRTTRAAAVPGWSDLPSEIGGSILGRVPSFADRVCFSSVCRQWRLAARHHWRLLPPALPWLVTFQQDVFVSLPDGARHRLPIHVEEPHAFDQCLLTARRNDDDDGCGHLLLMNPLSKATMKLPSIGICKIVVCSSDLVAAIVCDDRGRRAVAFCRPGAPSWSVARHPPEAEADLLLLKDIALHRGTLYALYGQDAIYAYDLDDDDGAGAEPKVSTRQCIRNSGAIWPRRGTTRYLVSSSGGNLLLVRRFHPWTFTVFEAADLDGASGRWAKVASLEDQLIFVSSNCSRALTASHYGGAMRGNRIFFTEEGVGLRIDDGIGDDFGIYDMSRKNIIHRIMPSRSFDICLQPTGSWLFPSSFMD